MSTSLAPPPTSSSAGELPISDSRPAPKRRSRAALLAGILTVSLGALAGTVLVGNAGDRTDVLAVASDVPVGAVLTEADVRVIALPSTPGLSPLPASEMDTVVGQRAAVGLTEGSVLTREQVTGAPVLDEGTHRVALDLSRGMGPISALDVGDTVAAVPVPAQTADATVDEQQPIEGTVAEIGRPNGNGASVVHLLVDEADSARLAVWAAGGSVSLVLTGKS